MNFPDMDHLAPDNHEQYVSMGFICQLLQILPGQLKVLCEECEVKFALVLDGVPYLRLKDSEQVAAMCRDVRKEICEKLESAKNN
jgi:hypothetical protein